MQKNIWDNENLITTLQNGGTVVMPTDTIYGIVGSALNSSLVARIYETRNRDLKKPCIILIGDIEELEKFSINLSEEQKKELDKYWPGSVSIIFDCVDSKFEYLHCGTNTLAFRVPNNKSLRDLLLKTAPLIAPSANTENSPVSENIENAQKYFSDKVDLYIDGGEIKGKASRVVRLQKDGSITILRE